MWLAAGFLAIPLRVLDIASSASQPTIVRPPLSGSANLEFKALDESAIKT